MPLKTSFFNKTVFRKNLTRFAPAWGVYTMCLVLGMAMIYIDDGASFWFASRMGELIQYGAFINLIYAPLVAMLLFGDLFNTRMCNALHAMPLRREGWFLTNAASGLLFSLIPTAIMALLSIPLLAGTCVHNAWFIGVLWFVAVNLEFLCFFGIAVFSVFCVGNRFAMAAVYTAFNGGAFVLYWMIDRLYTPMLYGVITPSDWAELLTPVSHMLSFEYIGVDEYLELRNLFEGRMEEMVANYWVSENYYNLLIWAMVGVAFLAAGLVLYRRRRLECAGDAMAIRAMEPVFLVAASVAGAAAGVTGREMFFGYRYDNATLYIFLACGLVVGWFVGKMLIERTTRVFRKENWLGLLALAAALCVSLFATSIDILGIETWAPKAENVKKVTLGVNAINGVELTEPTDIAQVLKLQRMALEDRVEESGAFPVSQVEGVEGVAFSEQEEYRYAAPIWIGFELENGRTVQRVYYIWADRGEGDIVNEYLSRWEVVAYSDWGGRNNLCYLMENPHVAVTEITFGSGGLTGEEVTQEALTSLLDAIKADCEERHMTQYSYFHDGHFVIPYENGEYAYASDISICFRTENDEYMYLSVFPDSRHTLNWMRQRGLMAWEVRPENISHG